jgi:hypothetical protein
MTSDLLRFRMNSETPNYSDIGYSLDGGGGSGPAVQDKTETRGCTFMARVRFEAAVQDRTNRANVVIISMYRVVYLRILINFLQSEVNSLIR